MPVINSFNDDWMRRIKDAVRRVENMPRNNPTRWPRVPRSPGGGGTTITGSSDITFGVVVEDDGIDAATSEDYLGAGTDPGDDSGWIITPGMGEVELYDYFTGSAGTHAGTTQPEDNAFDRFGTGEIVSVLNYDPLATFSYGTPVYLLLAGTVGDDTYYEIISGACASLND